jgi:hypothetical protein
MHRGYIALWRKIEDNFLWKERRVFSKAEAWLDLLMSARHDENPGEVVIGMKRYSCGYGQILKSTRTLASRWSWGDAKVRRFLKLLADCGMIESKSVGPTTQITLLNYERYDPRRLTIDAESTQNRRTVDARATTNNNVNNVKNEKNGNKSLCSNPVAFELAEYLLTLILQNNPNFKKPDLNKWAVSVDRMIRLDKRDPPTIRAVIEYCQRDEFWRANILSAEKLRQKFDQLTMKMHSKFSSKDSTGEAYIDRLQTIGDRWLKKKMQNTGVS